MKRGKYDHALAAKLWGYLVKAGAKKYVKEFGGDVRSMFNVATREHVAKELADQYLDEVKDMMEEV